MYHYHAITEFSAFLGERKETSTCPNLSWSYFIAVVMCVFVVFVTAMSIQHINFQTELLLWAHYISVSIDNLVEGQKNLRKITGVNLYPCSLKYFFIACTQTLFILYIASRSHKICMFLLQLIYHTHFICI